MAKAKYTRGSDGYFQTKVWDGTYNDNGTKHRVTLRSRKSSADLEKQVNALKNSVANRSNLLSADQDVWSYAVEWLKLSKSNREKNTISMYDRIIQNHMDICKGLSFTALSYRHVQAIITAASDKPRTCQQILVTFKQIVKAAIRDRLLPAGAYMEIFDGIDAPKYRPSEKRPLTALEKDAIFSAEFTPKQKAFVYTLYYTGVRRGEALALTRFDFNFKTGELNINKAVAFDDNDSYTKDPKSSHGFRKIPLPAPYLEYMRDIYFPQMKGTYLFPMGTGEMMTKSSFRKFWDGIMKKINLASTGEEDLSIAINLTPHVFRHNYCTELCYQVPAISFDTVASWLGDTKAMVVDVYSHALVEKENVQEILQNVFEEEKSEKKVRQK